MAFSYDVTTDRGKVRLLANDQEASSHLFEDDEIDTFLGLSDGVLRAAALACLAIAGNENLIQKKLTMLAGAGIQTDGPAVAKEMRELAKAYQDQAIVAPLEDEDGEIDIAEMAFAPFGTRQIIANAFLRERG